MVCVLVVATGMIFAQTSSVAPAAADTQKPAAVASASQLKPPAHPATEDQIREYLSLLGVERAARNLMVQMVASMRATAAPYYPASFWEDVNKELLNMNLIPTYIKVYQRYVSEEDMAKVIEFYRSPAGKSLLTAQPMLVRDVQTLLREESTAIGKAIYLRHKDEIEAAKKQYENNKTPEIEIPK